MEFDRLPISSLTDRYGIGRTALYDRLKALGIEPTKDGRKSYLKSEQIQLLDQLHHHLSQGGTFDNFSTGHTLNVHRTDSRETAIEPLQDQPGDWLAMVSAIAGAISPPNPIVHWEKLLLAASEGIKLSTNEITALCGAKPSGDVWERGSFQFIRCGKIGGQFAWKVHKLED